MKKQTAARPDAPFRRHCQSDSGLCDSMKLATDSAAVARLDNAYQAQLTRLNMGVARRTDTKLTEGENDTLTSSQENM